MELIEKLQLIINKLDKESLQNFTEVINQILPDDNTEGLKNLEIKITSGWAQDTEKPEMYGSIFLLAKQIEAAVA
jgi:hypothetical protein